MTVWYVQFAKRSLGPFDDAALKELATNGKINRETLIRNDEKGSWVKSGSVKGLFDVVVSHNAFDLELDEIDAGDARNTVSPPAICSTPPAFPFSGTQYDFDIPAAIASDQVPYAPLQKSKNGVSRNNEKLETQRKQMRTQLFVVGAIASAISLAVGYLAGAEHTKYSIRTKFEQFGKAFQQSMREGFESNTVEKEPVVEKQHVVEKQAVNANDKLTKASNLEASRRVWISISYGSTLAYKDERHWSDTDAATGKVLFIMNYVGHTDEYVELFNSVRNDQLRLFPDHMEAKLENGWQRIGIGHWKK